MTSDSSEVDSSEVDIAKAWLADAMVAMFRNDVSCHMGPWAERHGTTVAAIKRGLQTYFWSLDQEEGNRRLYYMITNTT